MLKPLPLKTEACPFCGSTGMLTPDELALHEAAIKLVQKWKAHEPLCPAWPKCGCIVRGKLKDCEENFI
jgi:hypothetical protein